MTNKEKYLDEIIDWAVEAGMAFEKGKGINDCDEVACTDCAFHNVDCPFTSCSREALKWLNEEYKYDKFAEFKNLPIDTKVLVRDTDDDNWVKGYFAGIHEEDIKFPFHIFEWGCTSWNGGSRTVGYAQMKLAED